MAFLSSNRTGRAVTEPARPRGYRSKNSVASDTAFHLPKSQKSNDMKERGWSAMEEAGDVESMLQAQGKSIASQIEELQKVAALQLKLTGVNPLSQEMMWAVFGAKGGRKSGDSLTSETLRCLHDVFAIKDIITKKEARDISVISGATLTQVREFFAAQRSLVRKLVQQSHDEAGKLLVKNASEHSNQFVAFMSNFTGHEKDLGFSKLTGIESVEKLLESMREESSFSGQSHLLRVVLQTDSGLVLRRFLEKGGLKLLSSWLVEAAAEEQTSLIRHVLKTLSHMPISHAVPMQMSSLVQTISKLRLYRITDVAVRARSLLSKWSKVFLPKSEGPAVAQSLPKRIRDASSVQAAGGRQKKKSKADDTSSLDNKTVTVTNSMPGVLPGSVESSSSCKSALPTSNVVSRKMSSLEPSESAVSAIQVSKKRQASTSRADQLKERGKVYLVEESLQNKPKAVAKTSRPLSTDDIHKAKMRARLFKQAKSTADAKSIQDSTVKELPTGSSGMVIPPPFSQEHSFIPSGLASAPADQFVLHPSTAALDDGLGSTNAINATLMGGRTSSLPLLTTTGQDLVPFSLPVPSTVGQELVPSSLPCLTTTVQDAVLLDVGKETTNEEVITSTMDFPGPHDDLPFEAKESMNESFKSIENTKVLIIGSKVIVQKPSNEEEKEACPETLVAQETVADQTAWVSLMEDSLPDSNNGEAATLARNSDETTKVTGEDSSFEANPPISANEVYTIMQASLIRWRIPPEFQLNSQWSVAAGEDSKEREGQSARVRREKEAYYPDLSCIPDNPKSTWEEEPNYDDSLTLEIPLIDSSERKVTLENENKCATVDARPSSAALLSSLSVTQSTGVDREFDAEGRLNVLTQQHRWHRLELHDPDLLALLLRNPGLVSQLTSGQRFTVNGITSHAGISDSLEQLKQGSTLGNVGIINSHARELGQDMSGVSNNSVRVRITLQPGGQSIPSMNQLQSETQRVPKIVSNVGMGQQQVPKFNVQAVGKDKFLNQQSQPTVSRNVQDSSAWEQHLGSHVISQLSSASTGHSLHPRLPLRPEPQSWQGGVSIRQQVNTQHIHGGPDQLQVVHGHFRSQTNTGSNYGGLTHPPGSLVDVPGASGAQHEMHNGQRLWSNGAQLVGSDNVTSHLSQEAVAGLNSRWVRPQSGQMRPVARDVVDASGRHQQSSVNNMNSWMLNDRARPITPCQGSFQPAPPPHMPVPPTATPPWHVPEQSVRPVLSNAVPHFPYGRDGGRDPGSTQPPPHHVWHNSAARPGWRGP